MKNINAVEDINVDVKISFPEGIVMLDGPFGFDKTTKKFSDILSLDHGLSQKYVFYMKSSSAKNPFVDTSFGYFVKSTKYDLNLREALNIIDIIPTVNLTSEYSMVTPGQKYFIVVQIKNPSYVNPIKKIKASLKSNFMDFANEEISELLPNKTYNLISIRPQAPNLKSNEGNATIKFSLNLSYDYLGSEKTISRELILPLVANISKNETANKPLDNSNISQIKDNKNSAQKKTNITEKIVIAIIMITVLFTIYYLVFKMKSKL